MKQPHGCMSTEWFFHQIFKNGGVGMVGVVGWLVVGLVVGWGWWCGGLVVGGVIRLSFQSNSNSQKLSLWCKKK